ncbi:FtsX-like permease family protein [Blautia sp.]|uniref:FtsX-like permease family protein n=1 Tax=Blautia sp. TaxID=1955243 RepID=UPI002619236A|nr:FtsX-like permease family protein [Blautia sp.]
MRRVLKLSVAYLRYYKKQTFSLFLGVLLSAALLSGVGSLLYSGKQQNIEKVRQEYGDWHYYFQSDAKEAESLLEKKKGDGYEIEESGTITIRKAMEEPYKIMLVHGDDSYLHMMNRKLLQGSYPKAANEVAMDAYVLRNLGIPEEIGSEVILDGERFLLSGILSESVEGTEDYMQVFVHESVDYGQNGVFFYFKFKENRPLYKQLVAFCKEFNIEKESIRRNNELDDYFKGTAPSAFWNVLKVSITEEGTGIPYLYAYYNEGGQLTNKIILIALGVFGVFILYSLFQVSVRKRMSQYSIMQTLGMAEGYTFGSLLGELLLIFAAGFPLGCLLGNSVAALLYGKIGQVFVGVQNKGFRHIGGKQDLASISAANIGESGRFYVDEKLIWYSLLFFVAVLVVMSFHLVRKMRSYSWGQMIRKESGKRKKNRKIYCLHRENLSDILTKKFMFGKISSFFGILFSLSIGGIIFLGATYVTENTKIHNELTFKADDGLGSDIQVFEVSDDLGDMIPGYMAEEIRKIPGVEAVNTMNYMLGEIPLYDGKLVWTSYFAETDPSDDLEPDSLLMEKYHGMATIEGDDDYKLKVNIYGYDDEMLLELSDYLLEGNIDPDAMRKGDTVIFKTIMGGQGTYDGIDIKTGDFITLKTPKNTEVPAEVLRFQEEDSFYTEQKFEVTALASRPLAKTDTFIGDNGESMVDIIMTKEQMEKYFGVTGYHNMGITLKEGADGEAVSSEIRKLTQSVPKCMVKDYTQAIETENAFIEQKMLFFYGVALVLLGISILHIINSMQYLVVARKHEFGILRAMGITDGGFRRMLFKEGIRYGIYANLLMLALYFPVQKILYYVMVHVYLYLHPKAGVSVIPVIGMLFLNIIICILAMEWAGRNILEDDIIEELNGGDRIS